MSETKPDIPVDHTAWIDLNTAGNVVVGNKMLIINKSDSWGLLYEGTTAPSLDYKGGVPLTDLRKPNGSATIPAGSLKIWAITKDTNLGIKLSVQEL